jgi:predicted CoA-binding protein
MTFTNPTESEIAELLRRAATIAVVGLSADPRRPSYRVATALLRYGYDVLPVNPQIDAWNGRRAAPDLEAALADLPAGRTIDIVDVFRRSEHVAGIVDDCVRLHLGALWLQQGVIDQPAAERARAAGLFVVMDRCLYVERARLV